MDATRVMLSVEEVDDLADKLQNLFDGKSTTLVIVTMAKAVATQAEDKTHLQSILMTLGVNSMMFFNLQSEEPANDDACDDRPGDPSRLH